MILVNIWPRENWREEEKWFSLSLSLYSSELHTPLHCTSVQQQEHDKTWPSKLEEKSPHTVVTRRWNTMLQMLQHDLLHTP